MNDTATSVNAEGVFEPFDIDRVPWVELARGDRFALRYPHLSTFGGGSQISVAMEILPPGKQANQSHFHMLEEEHVYVVEGSLALRPGARNDELSSSRYVCFPAGQKVGHPLFNHTGAPCRYLVFGNPQPHDVAVFPDPGRIEVRLMREAYRVSPTVDYWQGVDLDRSAP